MPGAVRAAAVVDVPAIDAVINAAAEAYRGIIPADRWHEPYMPRHELDREAFGRKTVGDDRQDFAIDESGNRVANQPFVVAQQRVDGIEVERIAGGHERNGRLAPPVIAQPRAKSA